MRIGRVARLITIYICGVRYFRRVLRIDAACIHPFQLLSAMKLLDSSAAKDILEPDIELSSRGMASLFWVASLTASRGKAVVRSFGALGVLLRMTSVLEVREGRATVAQFGTRTGLPAVVARWSDKRTP